MLCWPKGEEPRGRRSARQERLRAGHGASSNLNCRTLDRLKVSRQAEGAPEAALLLRAVPRCKAASARHKRAPEAHDQSWGNWWPSRAASWPALRQASRCWHDLQHRSVAQLVVRPVVHRYPKHLATSPPSQKLERHGCEEEVRKATYPAKIPPCSGFGHRQASRLAYGSL